MLSVDEWKMINKANIFTCFRIETEWDADLGADMYETRKMYTYVIGLRNVGKECWSAVLDGERVVNVTKLVWTPYAFWVCLHKVHSSFSNRTVH